MSSKRIMDFRNNLKHFKLAIELSLKHLTSPEDGKDDLAETS